MGRIGGRGHRRGWRKEKKKRKLYNHILIKIKKTYFKNKLLFFKKDKGHVF